VDWEDWKCSDGPWLGYCELMQEKKTFFPHGKEYGDPIFAVENFKFDQDEVDYFNRCRKTQ